MKKQKSDKNNEIYNRGNHFHDARLGSCHNFDNLLFFQGFEDKDKI